MMWPVVIPFVVNLIQSSMHWSLHQRNLGNSLIYSTLRNLIHALLEVFPLRVLSFLLWNTLLENHPQLRRMYTNQLRTYHKEFATFQILLCTVANLWKLQRFSPGAWTGLRKMLLPEKKSILHLSLRDGSLSNLLSKTLLLCVVSSRKNFTLLYSSKLAITFWYFHPNSWESLPTEQEERPGFKRNTLRAAGMTIRFLVEKASGIHFLKDLETLQSSSSTGSLVRQHSSDNTPEETRRSAVVDVSTTSWVDNWTLVKESLELQLGTKEVSGDVDLVSPHNNELLSSEKLFGDDGSKSSKKVSFSVDNRQSKTKD